MATIGSRELHRTGWIFWSMTVSPPQLRGHTSYSPQYYFGEEQEQNNNSTLNHHKAIKQQKQP